MTIDSISDMATIIRNAITIKNPLVTLPYTKNNEIIAKILAKEGFIHCVTTTNKISLEKGTSLTQTSVTETNNSTSLNTNQENSTQNTKAPSKHKRNDLNQKVIILALKYIGREKKPIIHAIKRVSKSSLRWYSQTPIPQSLGGLGIFIVSTSFGILTDKEAREKKVGGEILLEIW